MKGYQISQYDLPFCVTRPARSRGDRRPRQRHAHFRVGIIRVHLEEDTARLLHRTAPDGAPYSLMDVNRAGCPSWRSSPRPTSPRPKKPSSTWYSCATSCAGSASPQATWKKAPSACDANVSVRPAGQAEYGTKVEVKNMNSFKAVRDALEYEVERQIGVLESGGRIVQETRGWDDARNVTVSQRTKEQAHDYRYFPEPDLPPLTFTPTSSVEALRASLPELARRAPRPLYRSSTASRATTPSSL